MELGLKILKSLTNNKGLYYRILMTNLDKITLSEVVGWEKQLGVEITLDNAKVTLETFKYLQELQRIK